MLVSKKVKFRTRQQVIRVFRDMILAAVILTPAIVVLPSKSAKADTPQSATSEIVEDANTFLATLSEKQRSAVLYKFDDDQQRVRWSNFPTGFVPRGGLSLEELSDTQQKAALALVAHIRLTAKQCVRWVRKTTKGSPC
jgi:Protein of unknown function (DUF3500)